jgi:DHA2 family multidrug resistance protein
VLVPLLVKIDKPNVALLKDADFVGIALMALFLSCLEYVLEEGPRWDWFGDNTIWICAWISGLAGVGFVIRSLTFARPVVDLRALAVRNFSLGCWFSFITGVGIFGTVYLTPLFLGRVRGFDAWQIGTALLSAGLFQFLAVPIYGLLANRIDLRWLMMFGLACFAMAMWLFTPLTHDWGCGELLLPQAFRGFAQQFCVAPIVTLTLSSARSPALGERPVQSDAKPGRCDRHCGLRHDPQRPCQSAFPPHRGASDRGHGAGHRFFA